MGLGIASIYLLGVVPIRFDHPILKQFGVHKPQIIGFLPYWLLDKATADYTPYVTTYTYFGLAVDIDGKPVYLVNPGEQEPGWTALKSGRLDERIAQAKEENVNLSLLVHNANEDDIQKLLEDPVTAGHALVSEVGPIMQSRGFTDLNLDIESFLPASESARANYTEFVQTVADDVRAANLGTVTVEIPPIALVKQFLIDPSVIGAIADTVVLMTYDYHYSGSFIAGPVAPLSGTGDVREFDVEIAVQEALKVIPKEKIILGIPLYGYQYETLDGDRGSATIPNGTSTASNRRISELLRTCATCSAELDTIAKSPYTIISEGEYFNQAYFENEASLQEKIQLAQTYELAGVALWALGYEDPAALAPLRAYKRSFRFSP